MVRKSGIVHPTLTTITIKKEVQSAVLGCDETREILENKEEVREGNRKSSDERKKKEAAQSTSGAYLSNLARHRRLSPNCFPDFLLLTLLVEFLTSHKSVKNRVLMQTRLLQPTFCVLLRSRKLSPD